MSYSHSRIWWNHFSIAAVAPLYSLSVNSRHYRQALLGENSARIVDVRGTLSELEFFPVPSETLLPRILIPDIPLGKGCYSVIVPPNSG